MLICNNGPVIENKAIKEHNQLIISKALIGIIAFG
jgi:hypothetical protein